MSAIGSAGFRQLEPRERNALVTIAEQDRAHYELLDEQRKMRHARAGGAFAYNNASATQRPRMFNFERQVFHTRAMLLPAAVEVKEYCVAAYHGAVDLVRDPQLLAGAAAIAGVDGRHLTVLREIAGMDPVPFSFENQVSPQTIGRKLARYGFGDLPGSERPY
jgi:hypothetical protein